MQANQTCVEPRPRFKSYQETEEFCQRQSKLTDNKTIDRQDEEEEQEEEEEDQIHSDKNDEKQ